MAEYVIEWLGIGSELTEEIGSEPPWHIVRKIKNGRLREQVVRCRDCMHYVKDPNPIDPGWPMMCADSGRDMLEPDGFCAWGIRKVADIRWADSREGRS